MLSLHALACVAMLPSLVMAGNFFFGSCSWNFDAWVDPLAFTEEGRMRVNEFLSSGNGSIYLWNPNRREGNVQYLSLEADGPSYTLTYARTGSTSSKTVTGGLTYQMTPKNMILLKAPPSPEIDGLFSFNKDGEADLYPVHIGKADLILRGCINVFLGRDESLYVMSTQDYSGVDSACLKKTIKDKFYWNVQAAPWS